VFSTEGPRTPSGSHHPKTNLQLMSASEGNCLCDILLCGSPVANTDLS